MYDAVARWNTYNSHRCSCFVGVVCVCYTYSSLTRQKYVVFFSSVNSKYAIIRMYQQITTRVHVPIYSIDPGPYNNKINMYYGGGRKKKSYETTTVPTFSWFILVNCEQWICHPNQPYLCWTTKLANFDQLKAAVFASGRRAYTKLFICSRGLFTQSFV